MIKKTILCILFFFSFCVYADNDMFMSSEYFEHPWFITSILRHSYPEKIKDAGYDKIEKKWFIDFINKEIVTRIYCVKGFLVTESDLEKDLSLDSNETTLFSSTYSFDLISPEEYTENDLAFIRYITDEDQRINTKNSSQELLLNLLYDAATRKDVLNHIITVRFLGWKILIHESIVPALNRVQERLYKMAETDKDVYNFVENTESVTGFNWRDVRDSGNRSSHSWGISVDIIPSDSGNKQIYWRWTKDFNEDNWMMTPLSDRWIPKEEIIKVFEEEGFVWGGKWHNWDNMHFEYRPDLILAAELIENN